MAAAFATHEKNEDVMNLQHIGSRGDSSRDHGESVLGHRGARAVLQIYVNIIYTLHNIASQYVNLIKKLNLI